MTFKLNKFIRNEKRVLKFHIRIFFSFYNVPYKELVNCLNFANVNIFKERRKIQKRFFFYDVRYSVIKKKKLHVKGGIEVYSVEMHLITLPFICIFI